MTVCADYQPRYLSENSKEFSRMLESFGVASCVLVWSRWDANAGRRLKYPTVNLLQIEFRLHDSLNSLDHKRNFDVRKFAVAEGSLFFHNRSSFDCWQHHWPSMM